MFRQFLGPSYQILRYFAESAASGLCKAEVARGRLRPVKTEVELGPLSRLLSST